MKVPEILRFLRTLRPCRSGHLWLACWRHAVPTIAAVLLSGSAVVAQNTGFAVVPGSSPWAENHAKGYADLAGVTDLSQAIANGSVDVWLGDPGAGNKAVSIPGTPATIIVRADANAETVGYAAIHEWEHLSNNHKGLPPNRPPTDAEKVNAACEEGDGECAVLQAMYMIYIEHGAKPSCRLRTETETKAAYFAAACFWGLGYQGPPNPNPCNLPAAIPCTP